MATITKTLDNYITPSRPAPRQYNQGKIKARKSACKANASNGGGWVQQWAVKGI